MVSLTNLLGCSLLTTHNLCSSPCKCSCWCWPCWQLCAGVSRYVTDSQLTFLLRNIACAHATNCLALSKPITFYMDMCHMLCMPFPTALVLLTTVLIIVLLNCAGHCADMGIVPRLLPVLACMALCLGCICFDLQHCIVAAQQTPAHRTSRPTYTELCWLTQQGWVVHLLPLTALPGTVYCCCRQPHETCCLK